MGSTGRVLLPLALPVILILAGCATAPVDDPLAKHHDKRTVTTSQSLGRIGQSATGKVGPNKRVVTTSQSLGPIGQKTMVTTPREFSEEFGPEFD